MYFESFDRECWRKLRWGASITERCHVLSIFVKFRVNFNEPNNASVLHSHLMRDVSPTDIPRLSRGYVPAVSAPQVEHRNLIGRNMTAPPPALSPNSILNLPLSRKEKFGALSKTVIFPIFRSFFFTIFKLRKSAIVCANIFGTVNCRCHVDAML